MAPDLDDDAVAARKERAPQRRVDGDSAVYVAAGRNQDPLIYSCVATFDVERLDIVHGDLPRPVTTFDRNLAGMVTTGKSNHDIMLAGLPCDLVGERLGRLYGDVILMPEYALQCCHQHF